jgi:hypothetical protein
MVSGLASGHSAFVRQLFLNFTSEWPDGWPHPTPALNLGLEFKKQTSIISATLSGACVDERTWIDGFEWLPDGQSVIYAQAEEENRNFVFVRRDLKGGPVVTIRPPASPDDWLCLPGGRLIYRSNELDGRNLWQAQLDLQSNTFVGKPHPFTRLTGLAANANNATADGKRLIVYQWRPIVNVFVGDLQTAGTRISTPTRLTKVRTQGMHA